MVVTGKTTSARSALTVSCTLWWMSQWIEERKADLGKTDINKLSSYKNWVWNNKAKDRVGMKHVKVTPFSTPAKGAAAGSD